MKDKKIKEDIKTKDKVMVNLVDKDVNEVDKLLGNLKFDIKYNYVYSDEYAKDVIISQSIKEGTTITSTDNELVLEVSKGKLDKEKLKNFTNRNNDINDATN